MRKVPPRFRVPCADAVPPKRTPAGAPAHQRNRLASRDVSRHVIVLRPVFVLVRRKIRAVGEMAGNPMIGLQLAPLRRLLGAAACT